MSSPHSGNNAFALVKAESVAINSDSQSPLRESRKLTESRPGGTGSWYSLCNVVADNAWVRPRKYHTAGFISSPPSSASISTRFASVMERARCSSDRVSVATFTYNSAFRTKKCCVSSSQMGGM